MMNKKKTYALGCILLHGTIENTHLLRVNGEKEIKIVSLKKKKEEIKKVNFGSEFGIIFDGCERMAEGDKIISYKKVDYSKISQFKVGVEYISKHN